MIFFFRSRAYNPLPVPSCFIRFIRLRQNTLQLAAGMNGGANAPKLEQRPSSAVALLRRMERRVGFSEFRFDTPQLSAGRFIGWICRFPHFVCRDQPIND